MTLADEGWSSKHGCQITRLGQTFNNDYCFPLCLPFVLFVFLKALMTVWLIYSCNPATLLRRAFSWIFNDGQENDQKHLKLELSFETPSRTTSLRAGKIKLFRLN